MFTLKFQRHNDRGQTSETGLTDTMIECPHFEAVNCGKWITITAYSDFTTSGGVERHVCRQGDMREGTFDTCWVQNEAGKTIARYRAPENVLGGSDTALTPSAGASE